MKTNPLLAWLPDGLPGVEFTDEEFKEAVATLSAKHKEAVEGAPARAAINLTWRRVVSPVEEAFSALDAVLNWVLACAMLLNRRKYGHLEAEAYTAYTKALGVMAFNPGWKRTVKALLREGKLTAAQEKALSNYGWRGADGRSEHQARIEAIDRKLLELGEIYGRNLTESGKALTLALSERQQVAGLPRWLKDRGRKAAKAAGREGWLFNPLSDYRPFITHCDHRPSRYRMYRTKTALASDLRAGGRWDNAPVVDAMLSLRRQRARLEGHATFADYMLTGTLIGKAENAKTFLRDVAEFAQDGLFRETRLLEETAQSAGIRKICPWDEAWLSRKTSSGAGHTDRFRRMFPAETTLDKTMAFFGRFFGAETTPVSRENGTTLYKVAGYGHVLVRIAAEHFNSLEGIALPIRPRRNGFGAFSVVLVTTDKRAGQGLTLKQVITLFHELGHAWQSILASVKEYANHFGNIEGDALEIASKLFERFANDVDVLAAVGTDVDKAFLKEVLTAENAFNHNQLSREVAESLSDLHLHYDYNPRRRHTRTKAISRAFREAGRDSPRTYERPANAAHYMTSACDSYIYTLGAAFAAAIHAQWQRESNGSFLHAGAAERLKKALFTKGSSLPFEQQLRRYLGTSQPNAALLSKLG